MIKPREPRARPSFPMVGAPTALVVDDCPSTREAAARVLGRVGFIVQRAESLSDAREKLRALQGPLDLLVTEATLRDGTGEELVRQLRGGGLEPAVFYTSARPRDELLAMGFGGSDRLVGKPVSDAELAERMKLLLAPDLSRRRPSRRPPRLRRSGLQCRRS